MYGIGRHDGLKIRWYSYRVGSSPTTCTFPLLGVMRSSDLTNKIKKMIKICYNIRKKNGRYYNDLSSRNYLWKT